MDVVGVCGGCAALIHPTKLTARGGLAVAQAGAALLADRVQ